MIWFREPVSQVKTPVILAVEERAWRTLDVACAGPKMGASRITGEETPDGLRVCFSYSPGQD